MSVNLLSDNQNQKVFLHMVHQVIILIVMLLMSAIL